jgi:hypothetical protein
MLTSCNAARTLQITVRGLARIRRHQDSTRILSDSRSCQQLGVETLVHDRNYGYGKEPADLLSPKAKARGAEIAVMAPEPAHGGESLW